MLDELELGVVRLVDDPAKIDGILLYGSRARGEADRDSDFDLICILKAAWESHRREIRPFEEAYLDIYYAPTQVLRRRLRVQNPRNDNFILNALIEGRILVDRCGALQELAAVARAVWEEGPEKPSRQSVLFVQQQLRAMFWSIQKSVPAINQPRTGACCACVAQTSSPG